ncbi:large subunit ribosomal protein L34e [Angomonas deanei]|uniref:Ribosomal protein L34e, putative n=1 Tax=Angomonas deanei TaxID=59799 RepID=S9WPH8_9TRYP|nr:large subunit ribosomal protein L34e [Angomonas deanei]EPY37910.1 large subunit ribosomal protein L34e [Angomonas deanei]EPY41676.1 large subunit ribosomal protein L34e [Angomonas deanei]EPY43612.1 large subunit ribosomal protein L34e [Angomonas deanei]CAD2212906.1 Ribosomal protein L34e, putative [Angomonas deanei]|eukprot:EPY30668.1 large subunit ribosomal protein L34e [Angomonas deanei]
MGCQRVSYRRRMHYATRGNRVKMVRTPGNTLVMQKRAKRSQGIHTPWVLGHKRIGGTKALHHTEARLAPRHDKSVSRAYGGVLSHAQVRDRVVRAFLVEEQRIVKKALDARSKVRTERRRTLNKRAKKASNKDAVKQRIGAKSLTKKETAKKTTARTPVGGKVAKAAPKKK